MIPQSRKNKSKTGFTLVELLVAVGIIAIAMITLSSTMIDSLRAKNRVRVMDKINQNGVWINSEIRRNLLRAPQNTIDCSGAPSSLKFGDDNNNINTITCTEATGIASASAETAHNVGNMVDSGIRVTGCGTFVSCGLSPASEVTSAIIKFTLEAGTAGDRPENLYTKTFESKITIRN